MRHAWKLGIAVNVLSLFVLAFFFVRAAGGFVSGFFLPDEGHEIVLVPVARDPPEAPRAASEPPRRVEVPEEYRRPDPAPSPWVILPDGSVRFAGGG